MISSFDSDDLLRAYPPLKKSFPQTLQMTMLRLNLLPNEQAVRSQLLLLVEVKGISHTGLPLNLYQAPQYSTVHLQESVNW